MTRMVQKLLISFACGFLLMSGSISSIATEATNTQQPLESASSLTKISTQTAKSSTDSSEWVYSITIAAIGAFLGYGFALIVQQQLILQRRKKCIINIALELKDIKETIESNLEDKTLPPILSYALPTPIWDAVIGTGDILELKNKSYYDNLFHVYAHIVKLSKMEDYARESESDNLDEILMQRKYIIQLFNDDSEIKALLKNLKI